MHEKIALANACLAKGRLAEASAALTGYLESQPLDHRVWFFAAGLLYRQRRISESIAHFRTALQLNPDDPAIYADLGVVLKAEQRFGEAEAMLRESIRRNPKNPVPVHTLATLCVSQRRYAEAETIFRALLQGEPDAISVIENFGSMLLELGRVGDALAILDQFLSRHPDDIRALTNKAVAFEVSGNLDAALAITERSIAVDPPQRLEMRLASYMSLVGRTGRLDLRPHVLELINAAIPASLPDEKPDVWLNADRNALRRFSYLFPYYGISDRGLLKVHRALGEQIGATISPGIVLGPPREGRLRVGFISYNFGNHPIGHLLSVFFEAHDHDETELFLYSLHRQRPETDVDLYGTRIEATADHYRDCRGLSDRDLAARLRADDLHILIDLDGHLHGGRQEVLATRPARVQIHWLQSLAGCPAPYLDYTIVDRVIVPDDERDQGNGPLIRLADAFQCGERFVLPDHKPSRISEGLPEGGIVFCAFGNWLKIDHTVFDVWMTILRAVDSSVLWLSEGPTPATIEKIFHIAEAKGVSRSRLILAKRTDGKIPHLDRHRLADLYLDTFTFSAATSAMDALSVGLPVLTKRGSTAQGRLAEAHIRAIGPSDLIVDTVEAYAATAIRLANNPKELAKHRNQLLAALPNARLFDAKRMAKQFSLIYREVWRRYVAGESPSHYDVELPVI